MQFQCTPSFAPPFSPGLSARGKPHLWRHAVLCSRTATTAGGPSQFRHPMHTVPLNQSIKRSTQSHTTGKEKPSHIPAPPPGVASPAQGRIVLCKARLATSIAPSRHGGKKHNTYASPSGTVAAERIFSSKFKRTDTLRSQTGLGLGLTREASSFPQPWPYSFQRHGRHQRQCRPWAHSALARRPRRFIRCRLESVRCWQPGGAVPHLVRPFFQSQVVQYPNPAQRSRFIHGHRQHAQPYKRPTTPPIYI